MIKKISIIADSDIGNLIEALAATGLPVISEYELGRAIFLKLSAPAEERSELFRPVIEHLKTLKIFAPLSLGGATNAYQLFGHSATSAQQIACALDPFAYVSHLSAMEYHGLTFQEIADMQGCPLSTVKTRLYQGLSVVRRQLEQGGMSVADIRGDAS